MKLNGIRFIVGTRCNYNCFYCHHEGCVTKDQFKDLSSYEEKLSKLKDFCLDNNVYDIAVTGGEPFLYIERLRLIIKYFNENPFKLVINTNASLISKYKDELVDIKPIEFHINLSTLKGDTHQQITNCKLFKQELDSLDFLQGTKHQVKINIICLKGVNENELVDLRKYCNDMGFEARFLVFYDCDNQYSDLILNEDEICEVIGNKITKRHSYGLIETAGASSSQIVKCLCIDNECALCKKTTYMHISPNMNIKYCMRLNDEVVIDYKSQKTILKSFETAIDKLEEIEL